MDGRALSHAAVAAGASSIAARGFTPLDDPAAQPKATTGLLRVRCDGCGRGGAVILEGLTLCGDCFHRRSRAKAKQSNEP